MGMNAANVNIAPTLQVNNLVGLYMHKIHVYIKAYTINSSRKSRAAPGFQKEGDGGPEVFEANTHLA